MKHWRIACGLLSVLFAFLAGNMLAHMNMAMPTALLISIGLMALSVW